MSLDKLSASRWERWRQHYLSVRARIRRWMPFASGVLTALAALFLYSLLVPAPHQLTTREVNDAVAMALASATPRPAYSARVYETIQPSLVLIQTKSPGMNDAIDTGLGSGVVITFSGTVLTSLHVVAGASEIMVTFADGTRSIAGIIAEQPENDIAVLATLKPPEQIIPAVMGNPNAMRVGDEAFVVGNPFGLYSSMSAGVISGFDRTFQPPHGNRRLQGLIQIDAAVNPGNSGGPLLNRDGQVIGIVVGIVNPTEETFFIGIGFAVPIDVAGGAAGSPPY